MRTTKLASIFVYLFFYSTTGSADSPITINTTIDKAKVTTGDIITYTITMKHALDVIPNTPDFNAISKFNIIGYPVSEPKEIKTGVFEQKYSVKIRVDKVGTYNISPIRIPFKVKEKNTDKYNMRLSNKRGDPPHVPNAKSWIKKTKKNQINN